METQKPLLKDEDGEEVDVHLYRSMIGSLMYLTSSRPDIMFAVCACARYQVNPKIDFMAMQEIDCGCKFTTEAEYVAALSCCGQAKTVNRKAQLEALVDGKKIIVTKASVRRDLQLNDEEGTDCLPNATILKNLQGWGSAMPTHPQHTPTIIQPSTSQPQKKQRSRRQKRKDTEIPQSSVPSDNVADEAVNEVMDDSLVRAATTATGLDAEQDSGNIHKTQSKAIPNEPSSLGTSSGGGPKRQDTMRDTIDQTRFENVSKASNDSLITGVNTPQSDEDRLKLNELMEFCTKLQQRVLDLENTKTAQAQEITSLKLRVKKLEKKGGSRTHKLKRFYKERKIDGIDKDAEITLVHETQGRYGDEEMFDTGVLNGDEVLAEPEVTIKDVNLSVDEVTLAQALAALKTEEEEEERLAREKAQREKEANIVEWDNVQAMIDADYQMAQQMQAEEQEKLSIEEKSKLFKLFNKAMKRVNTFVDMDTKLVEGSEVRAEGNDGDDVTIDATPLSTKSPSIMLKNFNREDLEVLWSIVKARFKKTEPVNYMDNFLLLNLKTMFEHHVEDNNMYPLTNHTLHQMFNDVKLQVDYDCEMAFELLRLVKKQLKEGYVLE
ncbi:hypothetical protein Tco_1302679 [Tanacetum coccineum]